MFIREQLLEIVKTTPEPQVDSITAAVRECLSILLCLIRPEINLNSYIVWGII